MKNIFLKKNLLALIALFAIGFMSCEDLLETPVPSDQLTSENVLNSKETIEGVVNGMYGAYASQLNLGLANRALSYLSDENILPASTGTEVSDMIFGKLSVTNLMFPSWQTIYGTIYRANFIIENLPDVSTEYISEDAKNAYLAAAKFIRAENHFFLANAWGDVPLVLTTNASENTEITRTPVQEVYESVISDLLFASENLPEEFTGAATVHSKYQALALLARVYLYAEQWSLAEAAASEVINSGKFQLVTTLSDVFIKGSPESIVTVAEGATGTMFVNRVPIGWMTLPFFPGQQTSLAYAADNVVAGVEAGDQRWVSGNYIATLIGFPYQNKFRHSLLANAAQIDAYKQNYILIRFAEMYMIRAEARANQGNVAGAAEDLNVIRTRAGLLNTTAANQTDMLQAIEKERLYEFYFEGHRWFDLKRTNRLDEVMKATPHKQANWQSHFVLWPISEKELLVNPNLLQNPGY